MIRKEIETKEHPILVCDNCKKDVTITGTAFGSYHKARDVYKSKIPGVEDYDICYECRDEIVVSYMDKKHKK